MSELEPTRTNSNLTATDELRFCPWCGRKVVDPTTNDVDAGVDA